MSKEREKQITLANAYLEEGKHLIMNNKIRDAEKLVLRAKELFENENDVIMYANSLNALGVIYSALDEDTECAGCYMEGLSRTKAALRECEDTESDEYLQLMRLMGTLYNNIGSRYQVNESYKKALEFFKKAEEALDLAKVGDDPSMRRRAFVVCINFAECNGQLDDYETAWYYLNKAKKYMDVNEDGSVDFSYLVLSFKLRWVRGEEEYVREHLQELIDAAINNSNGTDYMEDMQGTCSLLSWMGAFDEWKIILEILESHRASWESIAYDMMVTELSMNYYKQLGDEQSYLKKCAEFADLYKKLRCANRKSQAEAIDMRIAFQENEEQRQQATAKSCTDNLTNVGNRNKLEQDVEALLPQLVKEQRSLGLGLIDIDFFKQQNDTYGHLQGDECLKCVAKIIKETVCGIGEAYRFGGDEFVLIIKDATKEKIKEIANTIKEKLHEKAIPNRESKVIPEVTVSQGYVCIFPKAGDDVEALMSIADKSLYNVKEHGRNGYYVI